MGPATPVNLLLRVALVIAALAAAGWLALSLQNERLQVAGIKLMAGSPPQPGPALEKFRRASRLSASQQPEQFQANAYFTRGERSRAVAMLRGLLAKEPDNRTGWLLLGNWLAPDNPREADAAFARARALNGSP